MKGIVITTHYKTQAFLLDLLVSLKDCKYPILIAYNTDEDNRFEKRGLELGMQVFDEFIYLHDTVVIKDLELFEVLFSLKGCFSISPRFLMYLGKYDSSFLKTLTFPKVSTKLEAVRMEQWLEHNIPCPHLDSKFIDGNHTFEIKHGRHNMVLENKYLKKYKGTWSMEQI